MQERIGTHAKQLGKDRRFKGKDVKFETVIFDFELSLAVYAVRQMSAPPHESWDHASRAPMSLLASLFYQLVQPAVCHVDRERADPS